MNQDVIKRINSANAYKASLNVDLFNAKSNEDEEQVKEIQKEIASVDADIQKIIPFIKDENYVLEEDTEYYVEDLEDEEDSEEEV